MGISRALRAQPNVWAAARPKHGYSFTNATGTTTAFHPLESPLKQLEKGISKTAGGPTS